MFDLKSKVKIIVSGEEGEIIGRAEYTYCENQYYIRYKTADGRAIESWWTASAIEVIQKAS